jgi:hypothetical protein
MKPRDFCYWLQGFSEISLDKPTGTQWRTIQRHLDAVFRKVTDEDKGLSVDQVLSNMKMNDEHDDEEDDGTPFDDLLCSSGKDDDISNLDC